MSRADRIGRREFMSAGTILVFGACTADLFGQPPVDASVAHITTSGGQSDASPLVLGMTLVKQPPLHEKRLIALRRKHQFYTDWLYDSTDKFRLPFATDVLKYFGSHADLRFAARVVTKRPKSVDDVKFHFRQLIAGTARMDAPPVVLHLRGFDHLVAEKDLVDYLRREISGLGQAQKANLARETGSHRNSAKLRMGVIPPRISSTNFLQLNEYLTRSLHRALTLGDKGPLVDALQAALGGEKLSLSTNALAGRFKVSSGG